MEIHEKFTEWAKGRGVKINGIRPHKFEGRGLGIIAERDLKVRGTLRFITLSCFIYLPIGGGLSTLFVFCFARRHLNAVASDDYFMKCCPS